MRSQTAHTHIYFGLSVLGAAGASRPRQGHPISPNATPSVRATRSPRGIFVNIWSVEGFCSEGRSLRNSAAIHLTQPGAGTRVRSWTPTVQAQHAFLVTHNESLSIADFFTAPRCSPASCGCWKIPTTTSSKPDFVTECEGNTVGTVRLWDVCAGPGQSAVRARESAHDGAHPRFSA
jgi:hypothetical protein